jgi:hypothetical protein
MNYIKHLAATFEKMDAEERLTPFHISLYMALFRCWNINWFKNPISIARNEMMQLSKIGSVNTYTKCLKELDSFGFIQYKPSFNPHRGSLVYLYGFDKGSDATTDKDTEIALIPSLNNSNNLNNANEDARSQITQSDMKRLKKEKSSAKKESLPNPDSMGPPEEHILIYFSQKGWPQLEAEKFFSYYQSNGWLIGGRTPMKDWKSAARNWMLNAPKFNKYATTKPSPGNLRVSTNKNYDEPL